MTTSSNGSIFRVTGLLRGDRWIPFTNVQWRGAFVFFFDSRLDKRLRKQPRRRWFETPSRSSWRHYNVYSKYTHQAAILGLLNHIDIELWFITYYLSWDQSVYGRGQWEEALHSNASFHWPSPCYGYPMLHIYELAISIIFSSIIHHLAMSKTSTNLALTGPIRGTL